MIAFKEPSISTSALPLVFMPYVSIIHDGYPLLVILTFIGKIRINLYIRHRDMEEVHIDPAAHIKPDLDKEVRVVLAAPGHIIWAGIKMAPDDLISAGSGILAAQTP